MATDYDDDEAFDYGSLDEIHQQYFVYDLIGFHGPTLDIEARNLFWDVMYNDNLTAEQREATYDELVRMMYDEYGIDFAEIWDWDDFRAWYDSQ